MNAGENGVVVVGGGGLVKGEQLDIVKRNGLSRHGQQIDFTIFSSRDCNWTCYPVRQETFWSSPLCKENLFL